MFTFKRWNVLRRYLNHRHVASSEASKLYLLPRRWTLRTCRFGTEPDAGHTNRRGVKISLLERSQDQKIPDLALAGKGGLPENGFEIELLACHCRAFQEIQFRMCGVKDLLSRSQNQPLLIVPHLVTYVTDL